MWLVQTSADRHADTRASIHLQHDSAETEGLDIPVLTTSSRLDVSTLNLEEPIFSEYLDE